MLNEGGYEVDGWIKPFGYNGTFNKNIENTIKETVKNVLKKVTHKLLVLIMSNKLKKVKF